MLKLIKKMLSFCDDLLLISDNKKIICDIKSHSTMELILEDNSRIIFESSACSTDCALRNIYTYNQNDKYCINLNALQKYYKNSDNVTNCKYREQNIKKIEEYQVNGKKVIRLIF